MRIAPPAVNHRSVAASVLVLFASVVFGLVSSVLRQEIG